MIRFSIILALTALFGAINCASVLSKDEISALTRDGLSRADPDKLLNGFFPAWVAVLYALSLTFFVFGILGFFGYFVGICKRPADTYITESIDA